MHPRPPESIDLGEVALRRYLPDDAAELAAVASSCIDHLAPWMVWATPDGVTVEAMWRFIAETTERAADGSEAVYAIAASGDDASGLIGGCGLHDRGAPRTVEIGYWLHPAVTGRGLMTRIVASLTDLALTMDDIDAVCIVCDEANERSAAIPHRLGFTLDRIVDSHRPQALADTGRDMIWLRTEPGVSSPAARSRRRPRR